MALSDFLNKDPFAAGGVMDAPDVQTRAAMFKLAAGLPMDNKDVRRLVVRQGLEQQSMQTAQDAARKQALLGMGGVDVRSYAGSMWAQPGSYTAARRTTSPTESEADFLLKQRFGTMQPGQMQIAYGGSKEGQVEVRGGRPNVASFLPSNISVAQPTAPVGLGESVTTPTQGVTGPAPQTIEAIMAGPGGSGSNSGQIGFMGGMAPVGQMQDINITPGAATPNQTAIDSILGTPQPMAAPIARQMPSPSAFGQQPFAAPQAPAPSALQQLTAINQQYGQLPQPMALEASTPRQQALAQQQQHFQTTQQRMMAEQQQKQRMATAASMVAMGQDISNLGLTPAEVFQVTTQGALLAEKGQRKVRQDVNGVPTEITYDIRGNEIARSKVQSPTPTPEQAAAIKTAEATAEAETKRLQGIIGATYEGVQKNTMALEETARAREAIGKSDVKMGLGADATLALKKLGNVFVPGVFDTAGTEIAKGAFSSMAITASNRMKGQGQITEGERKLIAETVPSLKNDKEAALYMMDVMDAVAKRELAKADFISEQRDAGKPLTEDVLARKFYKDNPLDKFGFNVKGGSQAQPASGQPAGKVRVYDPATRSFK